MWTTDKKIVMRSMILISFVFTFLFAGPSRPAQKAQETSGSRCLRPGEGTSVSTPAELRSRNGLLHVDLTLRDEREADGSTRYCYIDANGNESPTLRASPGDLVTLTLRNDLTDTHEDSGAASPHQMHADAGVSACASGLMTSTSTNLHFHGLMIPSICHQDDVLKTSIQPRDPPFQYRFRIPASQPPGLYWYHPHIHGFTKVQVLGGASGAIIVEGIERASRAVAGLPERVLIVRDQDLLNPDAPPSKSEPVIPKVLFDRDGDAANTGTGFGKPAKDLSINFVPVPYPDYPPAAIQIRPGKQELWRVLNASAITYLNLAVLFDKKPQPMGLVALDGVPLNENGMPPDYVSWQTHLGVPPGSRVEFIVTGPPVGVKGLLVTRTVDTGPGGENDPNRALATITASEKAPEPGATLEASPAPLTPSPEAWLGSVTPVRTRRLYFSEKLLEPNNPNSATEFYLTVEGQTPGPFDPNSGVPNIISKQGTVEDWIIENRSNELHAFHIHQLHFLLLDYMGRPVNEPFLRDTVNVPYYDGKALVYPAVRLRLDFRDPNTVGDFVYHCHLLEHEDNGMMGLIRVEAAEPVKGSKTSARGRKTNPFARLCGTPHLRASGN
jgi:FtsP/CotA-like multicopper oxidase with cupredoxin domain